MVKSGAKVAEKFAMKYDVYVNMLRCKLGRYSVIKNFAKIAYKQYCINSIIDTVATTQNLAWGLRGRYHDVTMKLFWNGEGTLADWLALGFTEATYNQTVTLIGNIQTLFYICAFSKSQLISSVSVIPQPNQVPFTNIKDILIEITSGTCVSKTEHIINGSFEDNPQNSWQEYSLSGGPPFRLATITANEHHSGTHSLYFENHFDQAEQWFNVADTNIISSVSFWVLGYFHSLDHVDVSLYYLESGYQGFHIPAENYAEWTQIFIPVLPNQHLRCIVFFGNSELVDYVVYDRHFYVDDVSIITSIASGGITSITSLGEKEVNLLPTCPKTISVLNSKICAHNVVNTLSSFLNSPFASVTGYGVFSIFHSAVANPNIYNFSPTFNISVVKTP